ncbi:anaerobic dehydrogenase, typically selenocysteine-containing [Desulfosporosinus orientis DSM 765]|uniref:Anaerobic dehydrogenase, typically selenocysteine-containing n=1 Tax=Desulfosporosinus orientis (strain ATCC 19365 / DSM 765 / NCIMB 8382 / VKM B-1628 / Singapore I) TaxID=768706 RepID=G7W8X3_DESOD|nr:molybdopterin-dependent oxidoreductase [Desulfosporosinus orientis]AET68182.1 anaerobic dehydrogenase, typically selenocysteine-containing [Desulfosporosinus orientis DSM 765]
MSEWKKTSCVLCGQNCGLEAQVENNRIVKVRGDKDNPRSQGYVCRKGLNISYYQHHKDRLTHPLKKVGEDFVPISWEHALTEIAEKLGYITKTHGPRALAFMGLGNLGGHSEAVFGLRLLRSLGSKYYYNALAGELTGLFWGYGRTIGRQYNFTIPDHDRTDMMVAIGWNGWMSHQMPQARRFLDQMSKDPGKILVVIDPRRSETAVKADIHLALRPGTDALLTRALIAIILQEGWQNQAYIDQHVGEIEQIYSWFENFDVRNACQVCELDYDQVREVARLFATRQSSLHPDLGVLMGRHSTVTTYLEIILLTICGRLFVPGGNVVPGYLMTMGAHTDDRDPKHWRTMKTGFPALLGMHPPNAMPEEIMNDHPERLRAVIVSSSNPMRSFADTAAYEQAFSKLDLLVTIDIAMTETAKMSDYVLPDRSAYERWDTTYFQLNYPEIYCQLRQPILEPEGETLEGSEIFTRLADKLGMIPDIPESLRMAASKSRLEYGQALYAYMQSDPKIAATLPYVVAKTLGQEMGSVNKAWMWALLQTVPSSFKDNAARAGFKPGLTMGDDIFQAIIDHPEGLWIGKVDPENNFANIKTADNRINLYIPEVKEWVKSITPESEKVELQASGHYPLILLAGRHMDMNANNLMRNPEWNRGRRACTLAMHPEDAGRLNLSDRQTVRVTTEAGTVNIELEITGDTRPGMVIIPHGFGLEYNGETYGVGINRLTKNTHRDRIAGTPLHRYIRCKVEA